MRFSRNKSFSISKLFANFLFCYVLLTVVSGCSRVNIPSFPELSGSCPESFDKVMKEYVLVIESQRK